MSLLSTSSATMACIFLTMHNFLLYVMNRPLKLPTMLVVTITMSMAWMM